MRSQMTGTESKKSWADNKGNQELVSLAKKASRGDSAALYELCERTAKDILFRTTYIMGNRTDAEDVTQEILIRMCARIGDLRDPKLFGGWLGKIIINESKRYQSENARRGVVLNIDDYLDAIPEDKDDFLPQECAESEECRKAVMEIVAGLPRRQREAVMLHYYDGLNVTQTAQAMEIPKQNASRYIALARKKLRIEFEKWQLEPRKLSAIATLPMSSSLSSVLRQEAELFAQGNEEWMTQTMAHCKQYILANPTPVAKVAKAAPKASLGMVMSAFVTIFTVVAVVAGVALGGSTDGSPLPQKRSEGVTVVFSGGVERGADTVYLNPERAWPSADSNGGEVAATEWWITRKGSEAVLYKGEGGDAGQALSLLKESGEDGEYMLFFRLVDDAGTVHRLGSNFYILSGF